MRLIAGFLILTSVLTIAACASQGPGTSTGPGSSRNAAVAGSATTGAHVIPSGYHREVVDGEERFCRNDLDTGSRVQRTKVCLTWDELQARERSDVRFYQGLGTVN